MIPRGSCSKLANAPSSCRDSAPSTRYRSYLFDGLDAGGQARGCDLQLIGIDQAERDRSGETYLSSVLRRIADHPIDRIAFKAGVELNAGRVQRG